MLGHGDSPRAAVLCHQLCDFQQKSPGTALSPQCPWAASEGPGARQGLTASELCCRDHPKMRPPSGTDEVRNVAK